MPDQAAQPSGGLVIAWITQICSRPGEAHPPTAPRHPSWSRRPARLRARAGGPPPAVWLQACWPLRSQRRRWGP